ncbi:MAG: ATP-binding protein, partial [Alphaproteobacteria bacterium]|nr:ATP-binding protein [Alphaproteobacteria bacterium]
DVQICILAVQQLAQDIGMAHGPATSLATAVSELCTNVIKYANSGRLMLTVVRRRQQPGIKAIIEDKGPGIKDLKEAMREHVSTGGSLGLGLSGTQRLVDEFEIKTELGRGTTITVIKWG